MADEPVTAWREPWTRTLVRWLTRHRTGVTAAGAAVLVALVGLAAVSGVQTRANAELKRANDALSAANHASSRPTPSSEANENVTRANAELQAANDRERERFDLAMDAIKLFHGEVSEDLLLKENQFEQAPGQAAPRGGRLLRPARRTAQAAHGQRNRGRHSAAPTRSWGSSPARSAPPNEALDVVRKAIAIRRGLAAEPDADDTIRLDLARNLIDQGFLLEILSDRKAARASYEEALAIVQTLKPTDGMTEPVYLVEARVMHRIGWLLHAEGDEEAVGGLVAQGLRDRREGDRIPTRGDGCEPSRRSLSCSPRTRSSR